MKLKLVQIREYKDGKKTPDYIGQNALTDFDKPTMQVQTVRILDDSR